MWVQYYVVGDIKIWFIFFILFFPLRKALLI